MTTSALRAVAVALLTGVALLLGTGPAWAHTELVGSDPAEGATLAGGPEQVSLTFSEPVQAGFTTLTVIGPDGADYHTGDISEVDDTVSIAVQPIGPAGAYRIGYRVVSADGHPVSGSVGFSVTTAGPGGATAAPSAGTPASAGTVVPTAAPDDGGGTPVWPWILGAVVLVAGGVTVALRFGRG